MAEQATHQRLELQQGWQQRCIALFKQSKR